MREHSITSAKFFHNWNKLQKHLSYLVFFLIHKPYSNADLFYCVAATQTALNFFQKQIMHTQYKTQ